VHAASVNALDWRPFTMPLLLRRLIGGGWRRPKRGSTGADVAGTVEAVGTAVTQFRPGDAVFGLLGLKTGAFAEYACAPQDRLASKPADVSFTESAMRAG
jgi:NADPH:quinone reductase-like Zn-dependent oxidoreductase